MYISCVQSDQNTIRSLEKWVFLLIYIEITSIIDRHCSIINIKSFYNLLTYII